MPKKPPAWVRRVKKKTEPADRDRYYFDWEEGVKRVKFIETFCRFPEGPKAGQLMKLENWQKEDIIYPAFSWKKKGSQLRRYRTIFIFIPRKNAKTTLIAAVALSILFQDKEFGAQMFCLGSVKAQSDIIHRIMLSMIKQDADLMARIRVRQDKFDVPTSDSYVRVLSNSPGKHGLNAHALFVDELHEFLQQSHLDALEALETSMIARLQPITFVMTTAGHDTSTRWYEDKLYALDVKNGSIEDDTFLPVVYEAGDDADWHDRKSWYRANPGLGNIIPIENFEIEYQKALQRPSKVNSFRRLHLNQTTQRIEGWLEDRYWMACVGDFTEESVKHLPCYCGLDLASTTDLNSFAMLWVDVPNWKFYLRTKHWVNEEKALTKKLAKGVDYMRFRDEGSVFITPGNVTDHEIIRQWIEGFSTRANIECVAYDRALSPYIVSGLVEKGIRCEAFSQGILHISHPIKQFEIEILNENIVHDGNSCMRWQMSCVLLKRDEAENVKITKRMGDESKKVDGPVASVMAFGQWLHEHGENNTAANMVVIGLD